MKPHNLLQLAWKYYKLYGFTFFCTRLRNTLMDALFGWLAPHLGLARKIPHRPASEKSPNLPDIFFLSGNEWELRTQRPQQLAAALAREGCTVHYCAPSSCPSGDDGWRITKKAEKLWHVRFFSRKMYRLKEVEPPENYAGFAQSFQRYVRSVSQGKNAIILVQQPIWELHLQGLKDVPIFYDCIDDHSDFPAAPKITRQCENALVERSCGVIYTSDLLAQRWGYLEKPSVIIRNACEYELFVRNYKNDVCRVKSACKVIGYHGALGEWFDSELVARVAKTFPEHTVRLVGAYIPAVREILTKLPNIELAGEVEYKQLPKYVHTFDVGLLPFRIQPLTLGTNPVKIYEYLAAGLPVVAVPLPEMKQFGNLVCTGQGQAFIEAVRTELASAPSMETFTTRQTFARKETWDVRAKALVAFLLTSLQNRKKPMPACTGSRPRISERRTALQSKIEPSAKKNKKQRIPIKATTPTRDARADDSLST